jgi:[ribosomal protein S5]-alanine N-acetyltransferase
VRANCTPNADMQEGHQWYTEQVESIPMTIMIPKQPIQTPRLLVRAFQPDDYQDLYEYLSDERVYRFEPGKPVNWEGARKLAANMSTSPNFWAVELLAEHKVIGQVYFEHSEPKHLMTWELGYILSPAYQRQGYMGEAAAALVRYGFSTGLIHRVKAHCNPENEASWKLLEKIGFRREGLFRQDNFFHRDEADQPIWTDSYAYARLANEALDE